MADPSFDVVSEVNLPEAQNAVAQAQKEIAQRYDLKGTSAGLEQAERDVDDIVADRLDLVIGDADDLAGLDRADLAL